MTRCYYCSEDKERSEFAGLWNIGQGDSGLCKECAEDLQEEDVEFIFSFVVWRVEDKKSSSVFDKVVN